MPINIPSGLYTGGRATFDTSPMLKAVSDLSRLDALEKKRKLAEEKAAREAIEKNYEKTIAATNTAGVRLQDYDDAVDANGNVIKGLTTLANEIIEEGKTTGKLNPFKVAEFKRNVERSKILRSEGEKMHQAALDKKASPSLGDINLLQEHDYNMFDFRHKSHNVSEMPALIPDFDEAAWNKENFADAKPTTQIGSYTRPGGSDVLVKYGLSAKEKKTRAEIAGSKVTGNASAEKYFTQKMNSKLFQDVALPVYQKVYGKNEVIDTPEKAAIASALLKGEQIVTTDTPGIYRAPQPPKQETPSKNILDEYDSKLGENLTANVDLPYGIKKGQNFRFVPVQEIDQGDRKIIQSGDPDKGIPSNDPISVGGRMGYIVKSNGWQGTGFSDRNAVYERQDKGSGQRASGKGKGNDPLNTGL